jgi:hypothetical protein
VPEIAEREPKVTSAGVAGVELSFRGRFVLVLPSHRRRSPEDSLRSGGCRG